MQFKSVGWLCSQVPDIQDRIDWSALAERFSNLVPRGRLNGPWRGPYGTVSETV